MVFNQKMVKEKLKRGWTEEDFLNALGIDNEAFEELLRKNFYPVYLKEVNIQLKKNEKSRKKELNAKLPKKVMKVEKAQEKKELSREELLKNFEQCKKELEDRIIAMEVDGKSLHQKRKRCIDELEKEQAQIKSIEEQIMKHKENVTLLLENLDNVNSSISDILAKRRKADEEMIKIEQQINSLKLVTIFFYENGDIESDSSDLNIEQSSDEIFKMLVLDDLVEELTLKQIKQLAKLLCVGRYLSSQNKKYEITFESKIMEEIFFKYIEV